MSYGQPAADVEAKPGAGNATKSRLIGPVEPVKDPIPLVLGNAGAVIGNPYDGSIALLRHADREARRANAIGQAVVDQVVEDATQLFGVCLHRDRIRGQARGNLGIKQMGAWQSALPRILDDLPQVNPAQVA